MRARDSLLLLGLQSTERKDNLGSAKKESNFLAKVVRKMDKAIHRINHCPVDSVVCFVNTYPLDSDLPTG